VKREYLLPAEVRQLIEAAKKLGRHSHRDAVLIMMAYRHALRVGELVNLRWDQVNFSEGKLHVNRLKHGEASIHYLEGDEMRALRKLQRDYPDSPGSPVFRLISHPYNSEKLYSARLCEQHFIESYQ
jgi:type 1 fimbriae regulatory protein FimB/type 1 fimbriae regulatory protein FimE